MEVARPALRPDGPKSWMQKYAFSYCGTGVQASPGSTFKSATASMYRTRQVSICQRRHSRQEWLATTQGCQDPVVGECPSHNFDIRMRLQLNKFRFTINALAILLFFMAC